MRSQSLISSRDFDGSIHPDQDALRSGTAQREGSALYRDGAGEGQREEAKIGMSRGCVFWFGGFETA